MDCRALLALEILDTNERYMAAGLTPRRAKVDDVAVLLEHVDLLDRLDRLDVHLLQSRLQLFVVGAGGLVDLLDLAAGSTLASGGVLARIPSVVYRVESDSHDPV